MIEDCVLIRSLGLQDYLTTWNAMRSFTDSRTEDSLDEIWLLEHSSIFTQGQNGKPEHILAPGEIPIIPVDRGGQVTYHGPGQLVVYTLVDLKRKKFNVREMVSALEKSVIALLSDYNLLASTQCQAPGVYIESKKICSIGLRIRRGCSFHGLALNIAMNLDPFLRINPCGYAGLQMTQLSTYIPEATVQNTIPKLVKHLASNLGYINLSNLNGKQYGS